MRALVWCAVLVAVAAGSPARAGAWPQEEGGGYWKFEQRATRVDFYEGADGEEVRIPTLFDAITSFYGEFGVTDRITPFAYVPFLEHLSLDDAPGTSLTRPADCDLGVRIGVLKKGRGVMSVQLTLGVPSGDSTPEAGLVTGDGEWNLIAVLQGGGSFAKAPVYLSGELGFNARTRGYSDEVRFAAEVGWTFHPRWSLTGRVRGVFSLDDGRDDVGHDTLGLHANDVQYLIFTPEISFAARKDLWVGATIDTASFVQNSIGGPTYAVFVAWKSGGKRGR
jgi:hypothetical protein